MKQGQVPAQLPFLRTKELLHYEYLFMDYDNCFHYDCTCYLFADPEISGGKRKRYFYIFRHFYRSPGLRPSLYPFFHERHTDTCG